MLHFIARRLLYIPVTLIIVSLVVFVVMRITGDPVEIYLGIEATAEQEQVLRQQLHLDEPLPVQFLIFLGDLAQGNFGRSLQYDRPAMPLVLSRVGSTFQLLTAGLSIAFFGGVLLGIACAVWKDRVSDFVISSLAVMGQSMPSFWLGILLIQIFALDLHILPTSGTGTWKHLILPAFTLAMFIMPNFVLLTRTSFLETVNEQYVVTARAKGYSEAVILFKHVLPNAINPVLSYLGLQVGRLIGGSIITETIFAWPGVGRLMIGSIFQRDVPVVIAAVMLVSVAIIISNLVVDIMLSIIDPRIRLK
jgi:peptide/nickel transport system permease protein/glutathione transport system permease protein